MILIKMTKTKIDLHLFAEARWLTTNNKKRNNSEESGHWSLKNYLYVPENELGDISSLNINLKNIEYLG
jgi:hypothetical protein